MKKMSARRLLQSSNNHTQLNYNEEDLARGQTKSWNLALGTREQKPKNKPKLLKPKFLPKLKHTNVWEEKQWKDNALQYTVREDAPVNGRDGQEYMDVDMELENNLMMDENDEKWRQQPRGDPRERSTRNGAYKL
ncbi:2137_t:CDS:2 [Acaulospora colombiana]|uniref:2137_t:CDS:1 n=1 Tax=Acaulospora colombiana TaxID=27376 RepID=A0ACA9LXT6_9GLOM|nr:2137_t:CDS:2 [Acaulospora colombiana]